MDEADAVSVSSGPRRIVCLTEEPTEVLYALGEQDQALIETLYGVGYRFRESA